MDLSVYPLKIDCSQASRKSEKNTYLYAYIYYTIFNINFAFISDIIANHKKILKCF